jgi:hypothetical protein
MRKLYTLLATLVLTTTVTSAFAFTLMSSAFGNNQPIPAQYTCKGQDVSPPLQWMDVPPNTGAFALIMHDPTASSGDWSHWVLYNIDIEATALPANYPAKMQGTLTGINSWKQTTYRGPCPPQGTHQYVFDLYALDRALYVEPGLTAAQLQTAMQGHIIAKASLTGTFSH